MKNALIIHGTDGSSKDNWFPWLKSNLEDRGYRVWVPDMPDAARPNMDRWTKHIFDNSAWHFDSESIVIGHSSGAVTTLGLLQALPEGVSIDASYMIGSFKDDLGWESLGGLFTRPFDFVKIKESSRQFYFIHSDDDPYCPLEHVRYLHDHVGGDLIVLHGEKHFSVGTGGEKYRKFPYLLSLISRDAMDEGSVIELYQLLISRGVIVWLDGGWGVDALLEKQTRAHGDVDIVVEKKNVKILNTILAQKCFEVIERGDSHEHNYVLGDDKARFIDVHVMEYAPGNENIYWPIETQSILPASVLSGMGKVGGVSVRCIALDWMIKFHSGYKLRESDYHDVLALCKKFEIEIPEEYRRT